MSEQNGGSGGEPGPGRQASEGDDRKLDDFVDAMDDPETIRRRGEARSEKEDEEYYNRLSEQHKDQIEDEMEGYREMGLLDGGGVEPDPRPYVRKSPVRFRPREERESNPAVVSEGDWRPSPTPVADARRQAGAAGLGPGGEDPAPEGAVDVGREVGGVVPGDAWIKKFTEGHMSVMDHLTRAVESGVKRIEAAVPRVGSGDLAALTEAVTGLEEFLRVQASDAERKAETRRSRWRWPVRGAVVIVGIALLVGGAAVQSRWTVLDDGTNGWKDIVWRHHGPKVAECIEKAVLKGNGADCVVVTRVR